MTQQNAAQPIIATTNMPMIVYVLFIASYFTGGLAALIGVILAYVNKGESVDPVVKSHYEYQIRTFWIGLVWMIVGALCTLIVIGYFILIAWFIWSLIRVIKGLTRFNNRQPI